MSTVVRPKVQDLDVRQFESSLERSMLGRRIISYKTYECDVRHLEFTLLRSMNACVLLESIRVQWNYSHSYSYVPAFFFLVYIKLGIS